MRKKLLSTLILIMKFFSFAGEPQPLASLTETAFAYILTIVLHLKK